MNPDSTRDEALPASILPRVHHSSPHLVPGATASCKPLIMLHQTRPMMQGQESMNVKSRCWIFHSQGRGRWIFTRRGRVENFQSQAKP
ncbi:hypothetical protein V8C43DRAFT_282263 [Trichoderma afarasin]